ncbi:holin family protein [Paenibacillus sp. GbtcB18]|uniref:phage holin family protein n=1 Tax=Paenibacillus sp. GbtcB18 TaxID=2824763 RepID=UPI001C304634|nr:phage holin family protein [Paenibacillus sp. GbtcB18]
MNQNFINAIAAAFGAFISYAYGGWSEALTFLLFAMMADYLTGIAASLSEGKGLSSQIGFKGLARKGLILFVLMLAHRIDMLIGSGNSILTAATYFYAANEVISLTENYGRMGLPMPDAIRNIIAVLKSKGGNKSE